MKTDTLSAPADASAPDANRAGPAMPENLARLLYVIRILLHGGRRLAALIENHASRRRGFWLFSAILGTRKQPAMQASLHRGLLRAAALEALLLRRAATGRDVSAALPAHIASAEGANVHPCDEQFYDQVARLAAERAQHDAPADPHNLATVEAIEAQVLARSIGRTIDDIRRDIGIVAIMCTPAFWDAMTGAIDCYQDGTAAERLDDTPPEPEPLQPESGEESSPEQLGRGRSLYPGRPPACQIGARPADLFGLQAPLAWPRHNVLMPHRDAAVLPAATGPPAGAAMKLAA